MPWGAAWRNRGAAALDTVAQTAEAVARASYGKLVAYLSVRTRDLAGAEDALAEAFASAFAEWPRAGIPQAPEAWLLTVARRKLIDAQRRRRTTERAAPTLALLADEAYETPEPTDIPDERLRLMFACAHPAIDVGVRAPLILQTVLGFDAATIASAFLVAPATMSQRLVRAKNRIRLAGIPFRIPDRDELPSRLQGVLEAVYAIYAEGWSDPAGTQARNRGLTAEAIWLGRLLVSLVPSEPEAGGLLALMLHAEARREARRGPQGQFVPLDAQDPAMWDETLISEAEALLIAASRWHAPGRYQLEAAVQSVHAARRSTGTTDWAAILELYDELLAMTGSVVVAINRAVALGARIGGAAGATEGLAALDALQSDASLTEYQPYWAARAALLARTGRSESAAQAYRCAIGLEADPAVRSFLQKELEGIGTSRSCANTPMPP